MTEPFKNIPPEVLWQETLKSQRSLRSTTAKAARRNFKDIFSYYLQELLPMTIIGIGDEYVYSNLPPSTHGDSTNIYLESLRDLGKMQNFLRGSSKGREKVAQVREGTMQQTDLEKDSQHAVVSLSVLNRLSTWDEILRGISEMNRIIVPGGRFIHILDMNVNPALLSGIRNDEQLPGHELFERGLLQQFHEQGFYANTTYFDNTSVVYPGRAHKKFQVKGKQATLFLNNVGQFKYSRNPAYADYAPTVVEKSRMQVFQAVKNG